jgi:hypothetical protein
MHKVFGYKGKTFLRTLQKIRKTPYGNQTHDI